MKDDKLPPVGFFPLIKFSFTPPTIQLVKSAYILYIIKKEIPFVSIILFVHCDFSAFL